jgi:acetylornithine/N-succinyldiaminopimelate aminotransferase
MQVKESESEDNCMDERLQSIIEKDDQYFLRAFGRRSMICFDRGEGIFLYDTTGKSYMDLIGGIAVNVLGHAHPHLVSAIASQAGRLIHCSNLYYIENQAILAERLGKLFGEGHVFFANSGAEANEGAIKLARGYFYHKGAPRARIVSAVHSFHGRTLATATATGQDKYSAPFAPLPSDFVHVPFNDIDALKAVVDDQTCAVMLELIQGESGVNPADPAYVAAVADWCREKGALLIFDEIQTGMGRTGHFFAFESYGIRPDIVTLAKGLAGGVPIGALIANDRASAGFAPGDHGSTFGGNPLACAAALAVLEIYEQQHLVERAALMGAYFRDRLESLMEKGAPITAIRGMGLMIGIALRDPVAVAVRANLLAKGYLVGAVGSQTIRLLPPLIIETEHIDQFMIDLEKTLQEVSA